MDTHNNNSNSNEEAVGAQSAPAEINSGKVNDAAQQLQAAVSSFAQETQRNQESLIALIKQMSDQLRSTDAKGRADRAQIDKLASQIRNYRS
jgi:hypothetical protein